MNVSVGIILFICWASLECCPGIDKVNFNGDDDELLRGIIRSVMDGLESVEKHASELVIDSIFTLKVNRGSSSHSLGSFREYSITCLHLIGFPYSRIINTTNICLFTS